MNKKKRIKMIALSILGVVLVGGLIVGNYYASKYSHIITTYLDHKTTKVVKSKDSKKSKDYQQKFKTEAARKENATKIGAQIEEEGSVLFKEYRESSTLQMKIAEHDYYIYDFALPMVLLYSLYSGKSNRLVDWLKMSPMKQFTTLDTHDGIGVVDAKDLLAEAETAYTTEKLYEIGANVKKIYSSEAYNNLDIYQINSTYYSALGDDDQSYLLARAIQCFAPGIPQVYYVGLLAGKNDLDLLEQTKEGRNINRHYYSLDEIEGEVKRPVVKRLFEILTYRNESLSFDLDGKITVEAPSDNLLVITRESRDGVYRSALEANLVTKDFVIADNVGNQIMQIRNK